MVLEICRDFSVLWEYDSWLDTTYCTKSLKLRLRNCCFRKLPVFLQFSKFFLHLKFYLFGGNDTAYCMIIAKLGLN